MLKRLFIVLVFLAIAAGGFAWWARERLNTPYRNFAGEEVFVDIPSGSSVAAIGNRLTAAGVLPDPWTFRLAARFTGADRKLQAGEYRFSGPSAPMVVLQRLVAGDTFRRGLTFPEGLTIFEMGDVFARGGFGSAGSFMDAASDRALIDSYDTGAKSLEGYLFPDTYTLGREASAGQMIHAMLARFDQVFTPEFRNTATDHGWSVRQVLTLASLIEKETALPGERPIVSAVYQNRLKRGMPLQCDPTVIYGLMLAGRWNGNIRKTDLQMDSPYNTYRVAGLPPGPIASPGLPSIDAALHPADVPYLYFVSRNDGSHVFAKTLDEHNANVRRFQIHKAR